MPPAGRNLATKLTAAVAIGVAFAALAPAPAAQSRTFDLLTATVADIQAAVDAGALTYERLIGLYLARIEAYDRQGPRLGAVLAIDPHAATTARALDEERRTKGRRSLLHGLPIAVKDNVDAVGMPTTGGNEMFAGSHARGDATVVQRLRDAGAIVFLKTNLDELALSSRGFSSVGGQTLNPYDLSRNPGGSSSGTAVAVSAGFAAVGIATETGYSIRSPATNSAIVGIAPSRGLVSRAGVMPVSFTQDRVGVHAKTVIDAAIVLDVVRGFDAADLSTTASLGRTPRALADTGPGLDGRRLGALRDLFRQGEEFAAINRSIEEQLDAIRRHGATVVDSLSTGLNLVAMMPSLRVNNFEMPLAFDAYLRRRGPAPVESFAALVASGKYVKGETLEARFGPAMKAGPLDANADYLATLKSQGDVRQALIDLMDQHQLDALLYPVKSLGAPLVGTADAGPRDNNISAVTGLPAIVVPAGINAEGLPFSLEILGRPFSEPTLIAIAHGYEQASRARVLPTATPRRPGEVFAYQQEAR